MNPGFAAVSVDTHAHVALPAVEALLAGHDGLLAEQRLDAVRYGPESGAESARMVRDRMHKLTDIDTRLADMDSAGVDVQIVSPTPSYHYWTPAELAARVARTSNELIAEYCTRAPGRLRGMAMVPLQHPELAVAILNEAITTHNLVGVQIGSHAPGIELSSPTLDPLWARIEELGVVVFLHPMGCTLDERLDRWYLANIVGQPVEHTVALSHLIFGGVLDRFPNLKVLAGHGGGYLPTSISRADHGWEVRTDTKGCLERPSSYMKKMWFDSLVFDARSLQDLVAAVGWDRVVLGSDYPFDMGVADPVDRLESAGLEFDAVRAIRGITARELFRLDRSEVR